eukprot:tig00021122_g18449.t1
MVTFMELGLDGWLVETVRNMGIARPTPIQENCIPPILEGRDVLGAAQTGSGKTAAFALPILQKLSEEPFGIFALVLTPTRELAFQIAEQFRAFGASIGLRDVVIVGGMDMMQQAIALAKRPHVVIATPGRLLDHMRSSSTADWSRLRFLVCDEADRLLAGNVAEEVAEVLARLPASRQTLLFSATVSEALEELQQLSPRKPFSYSAPSAGSTVEGLREEYMFMPAKVKDVYLAHLLRRHADTTAIVFAPSCRACEYVALLLRELGTRCTALHSYASQPERLAALAKFKNGVVSVLVATDVASRGLDIPTVGLVVNYNVPAVAKEYVHRVGRTARAGRGGRAVTLVTQYDVALVQAIEAFTGAPRPAAPARAPPRPRRGGAGGRKKLGEYGAAEAEVLEDITEVVTARRAARLVRAPPRPAPPRLTPAAPRGERLREKQKERKEKAARRAARDAGDGGAGEAAAPAKRRREEGGSEGGARRGHKKQSSEEKQSMACGGGGARDGRGGRGGSQASGRASKGSQRRSKPKKRTTPG